MQGKGYDIEQVKQYLKKWLDHGDKKQAAKQFGLTMQTISRIVGGVHSNMEVLRWLVDKAKKNEEALKDFN